jgi:hypothetical protein
MKIWKLPLSLIKQHIMNEYGSVNMFLIPRILNINTGWSWTVSLNAQAAWEISPLLIGS